MAGGRTRVEFVVDSSVRADVLRAVAAGTDTTDALLAEVDASESAVYDALSELRREGFVAEQDGGLCLTGVGCIVTDRLAQLDRTASLFEADPAYWAGHDASVLPAGFRRDVDALDGYEVVRATEADPHRVVRNVADRIESAGRAWIVTPIYQDEFAANLGGTDDVRLLLDEAVLRDAAADREGVEPPPGTDVRVGQVCFALTVTDECVMLSLPDLEGQYDARTELVAETDRALAWGTDLFEHCWAGSTPVRDVGPSD